MSWDVLREEWRLLPDRLMEGPPALDESFKRFDAALATLEEQNEQLRAFVFDAPTCTPTEENHYGWPKEGVRWRCFNCNEWCYPESLCYGCTAREMQAALVRR